MSGEAWRVVQAAMAEHAGDDNPSRVARNILHALRNAGFSVSRTAAPIAPSTAAGEREYLARQYLAIARDHAGHIVVEQHGPNGEEPCTVADLIDAALATTPAQEGGSGKRVTERWEPMETAPMDGTVIQFLQGGEVFAGFAGDDPDHPWQFLDRNGRQAFVNGFHHKFSPRWWRPLAEAPKEAALRAAQEGTGNG